MKFISSYCRVSSNTIFLNGKEIFRGNQNTPDDFAKQYYKHLQADYPKFYKMDGLSKYAFLATELLTQHEARLKSMPDDKLALIFANQVSSADTDKLFFESYASNGAPSPALFVYTLPNILIGELAIRHKWFGENLFGILPNFDASYFLRMSNLLLHKKSDACLCGWINVHQQIPDVFLFVLSKDEHAGLHLPANPNSLFTLYNL